MARAGRGELVASLINLRTANVPFGGADGYRLRVRDDSDRAVTLSPDPESTVELNGRNVLDVYAGDGSIADEPVLSRSGGASDLPLTVTGDTGMFRSESVFTPYTVELTDGSTVVATAGPRVYGIGYEPGASQDSTSGPIEVTVPKPEAYSDGWVVQLRIVDYAEVGSSTVQVESAFESRDVDLLFHVDGDTETVANLWARADIEIGSA
ncbi:hypothetical protein [Haloarcula onubensis]|uniref:Uncharacterized protein n=1 Tax=Haloarcula onubensis TaxID=2950539 RepID=A0ABU2FLA1_9EURY|nr:hypothetical protein [Halomicroarcula sp. S3CR25-11]MDS0281530.1 hypothetical protein [Halomicroarcula sp. S3CR25-11]